MYSCKNVYWYSCGTGISQPYFTRKYKLGKMDITPKRKLQIQQNESMSTILAKRQCWQLPSVPHFVFLYVNIINTSDRICKDVLFHLKVLGKKVIRKVRTSFEPNTTKQIHLIQIPGLHHYESSKSIKECLHFLLH